MTSLREASPENAAASQVLAGARVKGVRRGFPIPSSIAPELIKLDPQRPVPLQAGAFSFPPPACAAAPLLSIPRVVIPGPAIPAGRSPCREENSYVRRATPG